MIGCNERSDKGLDSFYLSIQMYRQTVLFYRIGQNECTLNSNVVNEDIESIADSTDGFRLH